MIQSIPSTKAEPFKRWLARVGYERVKGYSDAWIEKRIRGIAIREEFIKEWQDRGAQEDKVYEILTAKIS